MYQESNLLHEENEHLRMRLKAMQQTIDNLTTRISSMSAREACKNISEDDTEGGMESIVESYIKEIEELRSKVIESESMCGNLRRRSGTISAAPMSPFASRVTPMPMAGEIFYLFKHGVQRLVFSADKLIINTVLIQ